MWRARLTPVEVINEVEKYFERELPNYEVRKSWVVRKSNHPDDSYLYMVAAKKRKGGFRGHEWTVWTCWNQSTKSLNYGHYDLSEQSVPEIFSEYFYDCHLTGTK